MIRTLFELRWLQAKDGTALQWRMLSEDHDGREWVEKDWEDVPLVLDVDKS